MLFEDIFMLYVEDLVVLVEEEDVCYLDKILEYLKENCKFIVEI